MLPKRNGVDSEISEIESEKCISSKMKKVSISRKNTR